MQIRNAKASTIADCLFLFAVVMFSALPYVSGLGFYADDWDYLGILTHYNQGGFAAQFKALAREEPAMVIRPVHPVYFIGCFRSFGMHPMPYHILNFIAIAFATACLYLAMRQLLLGDRWLAFLIALAFGVIPHYCSDRFWFTGQVANLSVAFLFLGTYLVLRSIRPDLQSRKGTVLGIGCLIMSMLSYEITLGWIAGLLGFVTFRSFVHARNPESIKSALRRSAYIMLPFIAIGAWKVLRQTRMSRHHHLWSNLGVHTANALEQAIRFNFWSFGLKMPLILRSLYATSALTTSAVLSSLTVGIAVIAYLWRCMDPSTMPNRTRCIKIALLGLVIFGLGFVLFFANARETLDFTTAGLDNRIAIASAPGAACVLVALAALISSLVKSPYWRHRSFSILLGFVCAANCLVVDGIASYWVVAASKQQQILQFLSSDVSSLPTRSVLLLDGFCRYSGPGFVFETGGDATGAVQLALKDASLRSDVVSRDLRFDDSAVNTTYYGAPEEQYSYGDHLFIYNESYRTFRSLQSPHDARRYLKTENPTGDSGCPVARDGNGETIF
jgi:hypothetical protein